MRTLVVDASVAIKWVVEEPGTAEALALRLHRLRARVAERKLAVGY